MFNVFFMMCFVLKVFLLVNVFLVDLNEIVELLFNDLLLILNEIDLNLNISGIVIKYDILRVL